MSYMSDGVRNGIATCINLVIPSMFIFLIISEIVMKTKLAFYISIPFTCLMKIFKLSKKELSIMILSLIGGYPIGAKLLSDATFNKEISSQKASKMLAFCVNCSPAFLITGIGSGVFFNSIVGLYVFLSQVISAFLIAFMMSFFYKDEHVAKNDKILIECKTPISVLLVESVNNSVKAMALICGFVVAFSGIMPLIGKLIPAFLNANVINGLLEMTSGCNSLIFLLPENYNMAIILAAIFTSFGGICVFLQIACMITKKDIKSNLNMKYFYVMRPFNVALNVIFTCGFLHFFPVTIPYEKINQISSTFKMAFEHKAYSVTPISTAFLLLLSIMLLFFSRKSAKINIAF